MELNKYMPHNIAKNGWINHKNYIWQQTHLAEKYLPVIELP